jgi:hypothetical protein
MMIAQSSEDTYDHFSIFCCVGEEVIFCEGTSKVAVTSGATGTTWPLIIGDAKFAQLEPITKIRRQPVQVRILASI